MTLLIHSQTSTVQLLKIGNGYIISSHTLLDMWLLIHAGIKVKPFLVKGDHGVSFLAGAQCPDPGTPLGGYQILDVSYEIGRDLEFACNRSGYTPNGGNLTCELDTSNVVWNGNAPTLCEGM